MNTIEKNLKTDGKKFNHVPSNEVHDKILQNLNNPYKDFKKSKPNPFVWMLPIAAVIMLVTVINMTWNSPNNSTINAYENAGLNANESSLDTLVKDIENNNTSEIESEQMAILNDIKQFNNLFML